MHRESWVGRWADREVSPHADNQRRDFLSSNLGTRITCPGGESYITEDLCVKILNDGTADEVVSRREVDHGRVYRA